MHAAVFMYMLYSGMPWPYMHEVCSTACICGISIFIVCLKRPHYISAVFISMDGHATIYKHMQWEG